MIYIALGSSNIFFGLSLFGVLLGLISILSTPLVPRHMAFLVISIAGDLASCLASRIWLRSSLVVARVVILLVPTGFFLLLSSGILLGIRSIIISIRIRVRIRTSSSSTCFMP